MAQLLASGFTLNGRFRLKLEEEQKQKATS
jgi:hypothetical protein